MDKPIFDFTYRLIDQKKFEQVISIEHLRIIGEEEFLTYKSFYDASMHVSIEAWGRLDQSNKELIIKNILNNVEADFEDIFKSLQQSKLNSPNNYKTELQFVNSNLTKIIAEVNRIEYYGNQLSRSLKNELERKQKRLSMMFDTSASSPGSRDGNSSLPQIIWTGRVSSLGTLFHDLRTSLKNSEGKPIIDANPAQLLSMLTAVFVDKNGEPFSTESLKAYLDPKKIGKKAKTDRIEVAKIIDESKK